jgi:putative protease
VTRTQPDNRGAVLGEVVGREKDELIIAVSQPIQRGDGLGFEHPEGPAKGNRGFGVRSVRTIGRQSGKVRQAIQPAEDIPAGWTVVRSAEAALLTRARESFAAVPATGKPERTRLDVTALGAAGEPLTLICRSGADAVTVKSTTALAPATRHGLDAGRLRAQLGRLGETSFTLGDLDVSGLARDLFVPVSVLNDLRQEAVRILNGHLERDSRVRHETRDRAIDESVASVALGADRHDVLTPRLVAEVWRLEDALLAADAGAGEISLDLFLRHPMPPVARVTHLATELSDRGVTLRLRTPTIVRPEDRKHVEKWLALGTPLVSGHLGMVAELAAPPQGRDVVADYAVNVFNQHSAAEVFRLGARRIVLSVELTGEEMAQVGAPWEGRGFEVFAYGRPEGMTIEHCVLSAAFDRQVATCRDLCVQKHPNVELTDPAGYVFPVATDYACRNRLLHSRPVDGSAYLPELWRAGFRNFRLVFNVPGDSVARVTAAYRASLDALADGRAPDPGEVRAVTGREYTRGHFARAV